MNNRRDLAEKLASESSAVNLIDGIFAVPSDCPQFDAVDPATATKIGSFSQSTATEVQRAIDAAENAQAKWASTSPLERSRILLSAADCLEEQAENIAMLIALETGRPIASETRPEVNNAIRIFRYFAGLPLEAKGESFQYDKDVLVITFREALGVVGAIVPWNVPAMLFCLKVAPALATGNTVVVKPAEQSSLCSMFIGRILNRVLPNGILNIVSGFGETTGAALVSNAKVAKLTFTGSLEVGQMIYSAAANRLIPVTLELGGKSPIIIFPDVDIKRAVQQTIVGMRFSRQGQSCTSTTRILVHESIRDVFVSELINATRLMKIGDPLHDDTVIGSLISRDQVAKVQSFLDIARSQNIQVLEGGELPSDEKLSTGAYMVPTLVIDPPRESSLVQEEIFGPVATVNSWENENEAVEFANCTKFGLSACILSDSLSSSLTVARKLHAGFIQINSGLVIQPGVSFGGYKSSGLGREASLNSMLEAFTQVKTVVVDHRKN